MAAEVYRQEMLSRRRRSSGPAGAAHFLAQESLRERARSLHSTPYGPPPILYDGVELLVPREGDRRQGFEALPHQGVIAIVDSRDRAGADAFTIFYHDDKQQFWWPIGPFSRLGHLPLEQPGRGLGFEYTSCGPDCVSMTFEDEEVGKAFARDVIVRQRLTFLNHKTAQGQEAKVDFQDASLSSSSGASWLSMLARWFLKLLLFFLAVILLDVCVLYATDPQNRDMTAAISGAMAHSDMLMSYPFHAEADYVSFLSGQLVQDLQSIASEDDHSAAEHLASLSPTELRFEEIPGNWSS